MIASSTCRNFTITNSDTAHRSLDTDHARPSLAPVFAVRGSASRGLTFALLVSIYFRAGKLGLMLAFVNASATALWPLTGIAIAALLLFGIGAATQSTHALMSDD